MEGILSLLLWTSMLVPMLSSANRALDIYNSTILAPENWTILAPDNWFDHNHRTLNPASYEFDNETQTVMIRGSAATNYTIFVFHNVSDVIKSALPKYPFSAGTTNLLRSDYPQLQGYVGWVDNHITRIGVYNSVRTPEVPGFSPCAMAAICTQISDVASLTVQHYQESTKRSSKWSSVLGSGVLFNDLMKASLRKSAVPELNLGATTIDQQFWFDDFQDMLQGQGTNYRGQGVSIGLDSLNVRMVSVGLIVTNLASVDARTGTFIADVRVHLAEVRYNKPPATLLEAFLNPTGLGSLEEAQLPDEDEVFYNQYTGACTDRAKQSTERLTKDEFESLGFTFDNYNNYKDNGNAMFDKDGLLMYVELKAAKFQFAPSSAFEPFQVYHLPIVLSLRSGALFDVGLFCLDFNYIGFGDRMPSWSSLSDNDVRMSGTGAKMTLEAVTALEYFPRFVYDDPISAPQLSFDPSEADRNDDGYVEKRRGVRVLRAARFTVNLFPNTHQSWAQLTPLFAASLVAITLWWKRYDAVTSKDTLSVVLVLSAAIQVQEKSTGAQLQSFVSSEQSIQEAAAIANYLVLFVQLVGFAGTAWLMGKPKYKDHAKSFFEAVRVLGLISPLWYVAPLSFTTESTGQQRKRKWMWAVMTAVILVLWAMIFLIFRKLRSFRAKRKLREAEKRRVASRLAQMNSFSNEESRVPNWSWDSDLVALWIEYSEPMLGLDSMFNEQRRSEIAGRFRSNAIDGTLFPLAADNKFLESKVGLTFAEAFYISAVVGALLATEKDYDARVGELLRQRYLPIAHDVVKLASVPETVKTAVRLAAKSGFRASLGKGELAAAGTDDGGILETMVAKAASAATLVPGSIVKAASAATLVPGNIVKAASAATLVPGSIIQGSEQGSEVGDASAPSSRSNVVPI